jgi:glycosyltransferase involved in cell wall biosynthesis
VRTANLNSSGLLRRLLLRRDRTAATGRSDASSGVMPSILWKGLVPDPWLITWNPYALRAFRRELARQPADCLITSSPADSTHLIPLMLGRSRPAWIADFRDGWCFEPLRPAFPFSLQRQLDSRLENRVATSADAVVGVTLPIAEDLRERVGVDALYIPNGFDAEAGMDGRLPHEYREGRFTLVHTGPLLGPRGRDPWPLLEALHGMLVERPELATRMQVMIAGRSEFDELALLERAQLTGFVEHLGYVPRGQALALQRVADALILITSNARCEATGKLYEYMAAGRPIIALARGNDAARIVAATGTGIVVAPDDVDAIAGALRSALSGELARSYAPHDLEPYTYPSPAEQMALAVEAAIEARASHPVRARSR